MGELPSDSVKSEVCFGYSKEGQDREWGGLGEVGGVGRNVYLQCWPPRATELLCSDELGLTGSL